MKKSRFAESEIVAVAEILREHSISKQTYFKLKSKCGFPRPSSASKQTNGRWMKQ